MKVLITGANGFVGKNLQLHLAERKDVQVVCFTRDDDVAQLPALLQDVDFVFHLAGINRPQDPAEFVSGNVDLTRALCLAVGAVAEATGKSVPIVYTSSAQAGRDNAYGQSKRGASCTIWFLSLRISIHPSASTSRIWPCFPAPCAMAMPLCRPLWLPPAGVWLKLSGYSVPLPKAT